MDANNPLLIDNIQWPVIYGSLDFGPRPGLDLDSGFRYGRGPRIVEPRPFPSMIGWLGGTLPQFDIWQSWDTAKAPMGPFIGFRAAPGTSQPLQDYTALRKTYNRG